MDIKVFSPMIRRWSMTCVFVVCLMIAAPTFAEDMPGGAQLGMSADQLAQSVPSLTKVRRPVRMTGGLVGSWSGSSTEIGGVRMTPTYFFAEGELRRIEYFYESSHTSADFDALVAWGRGRWGQEVTSYGPRTTYASWAKDDVDAMIQQTEGSPGQLRFIVKERVLKDASQL